jgi:carbon monoxide dehydrogenase subunit G
MILQGTHLLSGTPEAVWPFLLDAEVIGSAMPGTEELVREAPERYRGRMRVTIGPITAAQFDLEIRVLEQEPPRRLVLGIDAKGRFGFSRGAARVELAPAVGGTAMHYHADLAIGGKIASVGQRLLDVVGRAMLRSGLAALARELERRLVGEAGE